MWAQREGCSRPRVLSERSLHDYSHSSHEIGFLFLWCKTMPITGQECARDEPRHRFIGGAELCPGIPNHLLVIRWKMAFSSLLAALEKAKSGIHWILT